MPYIEQMKGQNLNPTNEQLHILSLASGTSDNLLIDAYAGCGKTSTLEMIERAVKVKPLLYLVFNRRNADEATKRMLSTTTVRTFNSMGHRVWAQAQARKVMRLEPKKTQVIFKEIVDEVSQKDRGPLWDVYYEVKSGVDKAKALGYIPEGTYDHAKRLIGRDAFHRSLDEEPDELTADLIDAVLKRSIKSAYEGLIDFNDQIYMPALFGGTFPRFPLVKVDESQDLSAINHAMLERLVKGRIIAVGDPFQNIYGFRGAKSRGMSDLRSHYSMKPATLSVSFRCPQAIVENARWRVPNFQWVNRGGHVETLSDLSFNSIPDHAAILCRNNAPLFSLALRLLAQRRSVSVAGSEIGPKIVALMKRLGPDNFSQESSFSAIEDWRAEKLAKESTTANDLADCMKVFVGFGRTLGEAINYAETLFKARGSIRLLTGHKAKGLEFDHVIHINPYLLKDTEQDMNLRYVIQTRSKDRYYEVDSAFIQ